MKIRKIPFALLVMLILIAWTDKAGVKAVTKEKDSKFTESTSFIIGESKGSYLLLNEQKSEGKKEYINAYFSYNEDGLYVDGTDAIPMSIFLNSEGYLSLGFAYEKDPGFSDLWRTVAYSDIKLTLSEDPIYWKLVTDDEDYTNNKLEDENFIRSILPQFIGLKGYFMVQEDRGKSYSGKIDIVPSMVTNTTEDKVTVNNNAQTNSTENYTTETNTTNLYITANYNFMINLPNGMRLEGKFTLTNCYSVEE
ncbi:MAG: hypothetical protein ACK5JH_14035 [Anaerocolumna sp.]